MGIDFSKLPVAQAWTPTAQAHHAKQQGGGMTVRDDLDACIKAVRKEIYRHARRVHTESRDIIETRTYLLQQARQRMRNLTGR